MLCLGGVGKTKTETLSSLDKDICVSMLAEVLLVLCLFCGL